jgi:hypothetical protein
MIQGWVLTRHGAKPRSWVESLDERGLLAARLVSGCSASERAGLAALHLAIIGHFGRAATTLWDVYQVVDRDDVLIRAPWW